MWSQEDEKQRGNTQELVGIQVILYPASVACFLKEQSKFALSSIGFCVQINSQTPLKEEK